MIRKTIGYGLLVTAAVGLGLVTWYGRHALVPGEPAVRVTSPQPAASRPASGVQGATQAAGSGGNVAPAPAPANVSSETVNKPARASVATLEGRQYPVRTYKPLAVPDDPLGAGWWVTQAKLQESWDVAPGGSQTVLAVIDGGFALGHEEFAGRWQVNGGESGATTQQAPSARNCTDRGLPLSAACNLIDDDADGVVDDETGAVWYENPSRLNCTDQAVPLDKTCNRLDDDGNGYVDDANGWDFSNNDNAPQAGELNPAGEGTTHGTKVTGLAAATGNNGKGIAGVDWNTRILPLQAMDDDAYGDTLSVGRAIYYAVQQGADVISLSLGSDLPDEYVRGAVRAALKAGIVVVAASGNDGCDCVVYPANYPEVLAVGALASNGQVAGFSSYGQNVDVLAPGVNVTSTTWQSTNRTAAYAGGLNGTSFATPLVAGTLARLKSLRPTATPAQLLAALTENVNRLGMTALHDVHYGFGALDAAKAVNRMAVPRTDQILYAFGPVSKGSRLQPSSPHEPASDALVYVCQGTDTPSTAMYELRKGESQLFTISKVESQQAGVAGYMSGFFAYTCLGQPHDTRAVMRSLQVFAEFRNTYPKQ